MNKTEKQARKSICSNKKAFFDYEILEKFEAGMILSGAEVKACRGGKASLKGSYVAILSDGPYVIDMNISKYEFLSDQKYDPKARRKILLNKDEIEELSRAEKAGGLAVVPLELYLKRGLIKLEVAIVKGKKFRDKRATIKKRETDIEISRALKHFN